MHLIVRVDKALDGSTCRRLIAVFRRNREAAVAQPGAIGPNLYFGDMPATDRCFVADVVDVCYGALTERVNVTEQVYAETVILTAMSKGQRHPRHADNARQDDDGAWVPNHTPLRCLSMICYLNGQFAGGEISFEVQGLSIKPATGLMLAFPSDQFHVHEVAPVLSGERLALLIWWTKHRSSAIRSLRRASEPNG